MNASGWLTVCISGQWAGVDSTWEQKNSKPRIREMLAVGAAESQRQALALLAGGIGRLIALPF